MTDFLKTSVAHGLRMSEFSDLPPKTKTKLITLMAQISEASFRRGLHHGTHADGQVLPVKVDVLRWRYHEPLHVAKSAHGRGEYTAVDRLFMEYGVLRHIGFRQ